MIQILIILIILVVVNILVTLFKKPKPQQPQLETQIETVKASLDQLEKGLKGELKDEFQRSRSDGQNLFKSNREEFNQTFDSFKEKLMTLLSGEFTRNLEENKNSRGELQNTLKSNREEFNQTFQSLKEKLTTLLTNEFALNLKENKSSREELQTMLKSFEKVLNDRFDGFAKYTHEHILDLKTTVHKSLNDIRQDNESQLEKMRETVDEKLQKTLSARLSQSFQTVGKQLEAVQQGLGEMKNLASDVGGLKNALTNVSVRGYIGEIQLEMLLEQILSPHQYEKNVKVSPESHQQRVDFAIKLPGKSESQSQVWLPIDSKFPLDIYQHLIDAEQVGDRRAISNARKNMAKVIRGMAKDIKDKYIMPPHTTDFAIMFMPFESIYAEVIRNSTLLESLQREYKIIVTGPTTLAAILNSLQMGFRTLAIQKKTSQVWDVLHGVKKEFGKFGELMEKAQNNIKTGLGQLDDVMGKRTRSIQRELEKVETLPSSASPQDKNLLD